MLSPYRDWLDKKSGALAEIAGKLYAGRTRASRLSPLILMTDPERLPDIIGAASHLPVGGALIYRHFGSDERHAVAAQLRQLTFDRDQQFLIGDDPDLAIESGADGVHFRRDPAVAAPAFWRQRCPDWIITMAGIKAGTYSGDLSILDGLFISSVFPSDSPSAGDPIGTSGINRAARRLKVPVIALGGINQNTAPELIGTGVAGLAGVSILNT